ncbi:Tn3 family transposase [Spirosoma arcticum]
MARLAVLDQTARREFERPPQFNHAQRKLFFELPTWLRPQLRGLDTPASRFGFILQWGYFRASGRFFKPATFALGDILFVARQLKIDPLAINLRHYRRNTLNRHRQMIRQALGFTPFSGPGKAMVQQEAGQLVGRQLHPERLFWALCSFMRSHHIEVPTYFGLCALIEAAINQFEDQIDERIATHLTVEQAALLNELLTKLPDDASGRSIHQLARLKNAQELMRLDVIRRNMSLLKDLKDRYHHLRPLLSRLDLSKEMIEYYAEYVLRAEVFQIKRRTRRYLILTCFVQYQYFHLSDILLQTFQQATTLAFAQAKEQRDQKLLKLQEENVVTVEQVLTNYLTQADVARRMQDVAFALDQTQDEKYVGWMSLIKGGDIDQFLKLVPAVERLHGQSKKHLQGSFLHQALGEGSRTLMNRIADLLRHIEFAGQHSDNPAMQALAFYQQKGGHISNIAQADDLPVDFLSRDERKAVLGEETDFALYRTLLARSVLDDLKGGRITVATSHTYQAFEDYLIDEETWLNQKQTLLERAGLRHLSNWTTVKESLSEALQAQMRQTVDAITAGENLFVRPRKKGGLRFVTPKKEAAAPVTSFYPHEYYVSIFEVLHTVNRYCGFTGALTHRMEHNQQPVLADTVNFATLIGWGCNLGLHHMAKTSSVPIRELERATNWYFSAQNLLAANDRVVALMNQLPIGGRLREQEDVFRSASDGQKYRLALDSIHANYSAKYFGKDKGITVYSFISEHYPVFYTTVFSSGDYEAWYVLDGLLHNALSIPAELTHSTDSHGVTELNFALTHLLGMAFQPRIKAFHRATLYGMPGIPLEAPADLGFKNGGLVNTKLIDEQWDTILRLLVTIKLNHALPSALLRRLTSYANQHPLHRALVELGKIVRTTYLLQYMHEDQTRQRVNHQLTKIENMHQLAGELNLGKNGLIRYASKEDLLVMVRSKQLLINSMTCWNMLRITQKLTEVSSAECEEILASLTDTAPLSWKHINFQGEYDFSEDTLRNLVNINLKKIISEEKKLSQ